MDETNWIKISFDRIECSSLSRSAYCASPFVCVCVCVCVFSPPLDKVGEYIAADTTTSIHDRFSMQTQNCAIRSPLLRRRRCRRRSYRHYRRCRCLLAARRQISTEYRRQTRCCVRKELRIVHSFEES